LMAQGIIGENHFNDPGRMKSAVKWIIPICSLIVLSLLCPPRLAAQVRVFAGDGFHFHTPVLRFENGRTLPPYSYNINEAYYTVVGNRIMEGPMGSEFDLIYTIRDNKVYTGTAMYSSQIRYTFSEGRLYKGDSTFLLDVLYTFRDQVIYQGANSFPTDAIYLIEGQVGLSQLVAIMLSLGLIA